MKLADRILELRKQKGISQEELADKLGVSRQAVSKWESEQSTPDIDKLILMSEYFGVTTDYLLKGIEPVNNEKGNTFRTVCAAAPFIAWFGYISSAVLWYEYQNAFALLNGFFWIGLSAVLIYSAKMNGMADQKCVRKYWIFTFPALSIFAGSLLYNFITCRTAAPYPVGIPSPASFVVWLFALAALNIAVYFQLKK